VRNVFCRDYRKCLDKAIKAGLNDFDCKGCPLEHDETRVDDLWPCLLLLAAIFKPKLYSNFQMSLQNRLSREEIQQVMRGLNREEINYFSVVDKTINF
jgi:hypothetical protein